MLYGGASGLAFPSRVPRGMLRHSRSEIESRESPAVNKFVNYYCHKSI